MFTMLINKLRRYMLKKAIIQQGYIRVPVIIDKNTERILDGNNRVQIARELGMPVPVAYVDAEIVIEDDASLL